MANPTVTAPQQTVDYRKLLLPALLLPFHGYYNFIQPDGWLNGSLAFLRETALIICGVSLFFGNYYACLDEKRHAAERNVRRAAHAANAMGTAYVAFGLIWGSFLLINDPDDVNGDSFGIMNNRLFLVVLMAMAFVMRLVSLKPGAGEVEFVKYILRYPWRFIWPGQSDGFAKVKNA